MKTAKQNLDESIVAVVSETDVVFNRLDTIREMSEGKSRIFVSQEEFKLLMEAAERLKKNVHDAQFYNKLVYQNRGKKTSFVKKRTSAENGKKGGRPPKEITLARRRVGELDDLKFESGVKITDDMRKEYNELVRKIHEWEDSKGILWSCWEDAL